MEVKVGLCVEAAHESSQQDGCDDMECWQGGSMRESTRKTLNCC